MKRCFSAKRGQAGFTLIETLIGVVIFSIIALSAWVGLVKILDAVQVLRTKTTATNLATEQFEIIRNLPYVDVGVIGSIPDGLVPHEQYLERDGHQFKVITVIRNIDLPFDGTIGGDPNDLSPADNKLVELTIECNDCGSKDIASVTYTTHIAPLALESSGDNGALFISVFDGNGQPVAGANVHIENNLENPPIVIDDTTNNEGLLQIVDAPPGVEAYEISVSKSNYSSEQTYTTGAPSNPVPDKPHANVASGQVTEISFSIDELSDLEVNTRSIVCNGVSNVDFNLQSSKTVGQNVYKYDEDYFSNSSGYLVINNLEWDTYNFTLLESGLDLIGANPALPFDINPGTDHSIDLIFGNSDPNAVLFTLVDGSNEQLLSDAEILLEQGSFTATSTTGSGYLEQIDWSGSHGQENFVDETRYYSQDGDLETNSPAGEITLVEFAGNYQTNGWLESSTFDIGTTTNFLTLDWGPADQPQQAGPTPVQFQIATNETLEEPLVWDYVGPTGSASSYYTEPGQAIHSSHDGDRYLRYRFNLSTEDTNYTPNISDIRFTFATNCTPVGQAYFSDLNSSPYDITITKSGYETVILNDILFSQNWQAVTITLNAL